MAKIFIEEVK
jgi:hypothetical protein